MDSYSCEGVLLIPTEHNKADGWRERLVAGNQIKIILNCNDDVGRGPKPRSGSVILSGENYKQEKLFEVNMRTVRRYFVRDRTWHEITAGNGRRFVLSFTTGGPSSSSSSSTDFDVFYERLQGVLRSLGKLIVPSEGDRRTDDHITVLKATRLPPPKPPRAFQNPPTSPMTTSDGETGEDGGGEISAESFDEGNARNRCDAACVALNGNGENSYDTRPTHQAELAPPMNDGINQTDRAKNDYDNYCKMADLQKKPLPSRTAPPPPHTPSPFPFSLPLSPHPAAYLPPHRAPAPAFSSSPAPAVMPTPAPTPTPTPSHPTPSSHTDRSASSALSSYPVGAPPSRPPPPTFSPLPPSRLAADPPALRHEINPTKLHPRLPDSSSFSSSSVNAEEAGRTETTTSITKSTETIAVTSKIPDEPISSEVPNSNVLIVNPTRVLISGTLSTSEDWPCSRCTLVNPSAADRCAACDQVRCSSAKAAAVFENNLVHRLPSTYLASSAFMRSLLAREVSEGGKEEGGGGGGIGRGGEGGGVGVGGGEGEVRAASDNFNDLWMCSICSAKNKHDDFACHSCAAWICSHCTLHNGSDRWACFTCSRSRINRRC